MIKKIAKITEEHGRY